MSANNISIPFFIFDMLRGYTENLLILSDVNPYAFRLNGRMYSMHASEIHDSGEGRINHDEWRIQLQSSIKRKQVERVGQGYSILFIGFFPDGKTFSAWEPERIASLSLNGTGSIYIPFSHKARVAQVGGAVHTVNARNLGRPSVELTLPSEALGFYIENYLLLHQVSTEEELLQIIAGSQSAVFSDVFTGTEVTEVVLHGQRRRVTVTRTAYARNPKFREAVLTAYGHRCCVCNRQLGLVQAAHIVPHQHVESSDDVSNGLALCIEHHKLYDDALLLPRAGQVFHLNLHRVEHLKNIGQVEGLDQIEALAATNYRIPVRASDRPSDGNLERGMRIRLGTDI
ncbi:HNH endonuclease [Novosphingobium sp. PhB57]|uniref:HNH endonuclease n=1 Tax=Novosphingobium sp. PhB57 TaxID=2485107 RepID=UPI00104353FB|nr:HNH endonuclease [Novosphingobium sp. PhB57]TCU52338.1 HNH endonuclease [Novosphingobium sp. PhB57]